MRINRFVATATGMSRRAADTAVAEGRVSVNKIAATIGQQVEGNDEVELDHVALQIPAARTVLLNKPTGYVTSRRKQGSTPTVYALLPPELHSLKPVGRLDRDSSGLLLLTNDGELAQRLQHPSHNKWKVYQVELDRLPTNETLGRLRKGVELEDGVSYLEEVEAAGKQLTVRLQEGRNRQVRRTFAALGYTVTKLHRTQFGELELGSTKSGLWREIEEWL